MSERTKFYENNFKEYFYYKDLVNNTNTEKPFLKSSSINLENIKNDNFDENDSNIERSYNYNFVQKGLINPIINLFENNEAILLHHFIKYYNETSNIKIFLDKMLYIYSNLIINLKQTDLDKVLKNIDGIDSKILLNNTILEENDKIQIKNYLIKNYSNKRIDNIEINNKLYKFDAINLKNTQSIENINDDSLKELMENDITINLEKPFYMYILLLYKSGFFNFYNHMYDILNECDNQENNKYYCKRLKLGAIKYLQYCIFSDVLKNYISKNIIHDTQLVYSDTSLTRNNILLSETDFNDPNYYISYISSGNLKSSVNDLKRDILLYVEFQNLSESQIDIYNSLINLKTSNYIELEKSTNENKDNINNYTTEKLRKNNIVRTLKEKNERSLTQLTNNRKTLMLYSFLLIIYVIFNMLTLLKLTDISSELLLVLNMLILVIIIIYFFIKIIKNILI